MLTATRRAWTAFWQSSASGLVAASDRPALARLFKLTDELDRTTRAARRERIVEGSKGQPVLSPLYQEARRLRSEVLALEERFGLNPLARLKLGVTVLETKTLTALLDDGETTDGAVDDF